MKGLSSKTENYIASLVSKMRVEKGLDKPKKSDKKKEKRNVFGGGEKSYKKSLKISALLNIPYTVIECGSTKEIIYKDRSQRFVTDKRKDPKLGAGCLAVIREANKFREEWGELPWEPRTTYEKNNMAFADFILQGNREYYEVDIKACYWTIANKAGIISDKTYNKYLDVKSVRLKAIGNCNKATVTTEYVGDKMVAGSRKVQENKNAWVWHYVVYKTFEIYREINNKLNRGIFFFKSDCFTVKPKDVEKIKKELEFRGFSYTIKKFTIVAREGGKLVRVSDEGELKKTVFDCPRILEKALPEFAMDI